MIDQNALVSIVGGLVLLFGVGAAVNWLRRDAARKRADKDPTNDAHADLEESIADSLEALPLPLKRRKPPGE